MPGIESIIFILQIALQLIAAVLVIRAQSIAPKPRLLAGTALLIMAMRRVSAATIATLDADSIVGVFDRRVLPFIITLLWVGFAVEIYWEGKRRRTTRG